VGKKVKGIKEKIQKPENVKGGKIYQQKISRRAYI
jgi:hypothetical protein